MTASRTVILDCHHTLIFQNTPPGIGEEMWCPRCTGERVVTEYQPKKDQRIARCVNRGKDSPCGGWEHHCGTSMEAALKAVARHRKGFPSHSVEVTTGSGRVLRRFDSEEVLPFVTENLVESGVRG